MGGVPIKARRGEEAQSVIIPSPLAENSLTTHYIGSLNPMDDACTTPEVDMQTDNRIQLSCSHAVHVHASRVHLLPKSRSTHLGYTFAFFASFRQRALVDSWQYLAHRFSWC